jgi:signal peptidase I
MTQDSHREKGLKAMPASRSEDRPQRKNILLRLVLVLTGPWTLRNLFNWALLILIIFFIKGCVLDQYTIPSGSMAPVLQGGSFFSGDRVLVNKWIFGPRIPFTAKRLWKWKEPERWDIVVFYAVHENAEHPVLIKRVAGLPGEQVLIRDGELLVNGEVAAPPEELRDIIEYTTDFPFSRQDTLRAFLELAKRNAPLDALNPANDTVRQLYADMDAWHPRVRNLDIGALTDDAAEDLCEGVSPVSLGIIMKLFRLKQDPLVYGIIDEPQYTQVPEGHYFLLGDNSTRSADGRVWGWVPHDHLLGRAFAIWWPWTHRRDFTGFSRTWWGKTLLYGIPAALLLAELALFRRERRRKKTGA